MKKKIICGLIALCLIGAIGGGYYYYSYHRASSLQVSGIKEGGVNLLKDGEAISIKTTPAHADVDISFSNSALSYKKGIQSATTLQVEQASCGNIFKTINHNGYSYIAFVDTKEGKTESDGHCTVIAIKQSDQSRLLQANLSISYESLSFDGFYKDHGVRISGEKDGKTISYRLKPRSHGDNEEVKTVESQTTSYGSDLTYNDNTETLTKTNQWTLSVSSSKRKDHNDPENELDLLGASSAQDYDYVMIDMLEGTVKINKTKTTLKSGVYLLKISHQGKILSSHLMSGYGFMKKDYQLADATLHGWPLISYATTTDDGSNDTNLVLLDSQYKQVFDYSLSIKKGNYLGGGVAGLYNVNANTVGFYLSTDTAIYSAQIFYSTMSVKASGLTEKDYAFILVPQMGTWK